MTPHDKLEQQYYESIRSLETIRENRGRFLPPTDEEVADVLLQRAKLIEEKSRAASCSAQAGYNET